MVNGSKQSFLRNRFVRLLVHNSIRDRNIECLCELPAYLLIGSTNKNVEL